MKTRTLILVALSLICAATIILSACTKKEAMSLPKKNAPPPLMVIKTSTVSNLMGDTTITHSDTSYAFETDDWTSMPFDSCTNERVALTGTIRVVYDATIVDSVSEQTKGYIEYDSVYGIGQLTGNPYTYRHKIYDREENVWTGQWFFQTVYSYREHIALRAQGADNDFVIDTQTKIVADTSGNITTNIQYSNAVCK